MPFSFLPSPFLGFCVALFGSCLQTAYSTWAAKVEHPRPADKPYVVPAPEAMQGRILFDVNLLGGATGISISQLLNDTSELGSMKAPLIFFTARRQIDANECSEVLTTMGKPHLLKTSEKKFSPRDGLMKAFAFIELRCSVVDDVPGVLEVLGTVEGVDVCVVKCIDMHYKKYVDDSTSAGAYLLPTSDVSEFKFLMLSKFSLDACAKVWVMLAHGEKGLTCSDQIIVQPSNFPLGRAIEEGGISLAQEPCVAFVAHTRATRGLYFLKQCKVGEDSTMLTTYFGA